jgi:hypothetical protein
MDMNGMDQKKTVKPRNRNMPCCFIRCSNEVVLSFERGFAVPKFHQLS